MNPTNERHASYWQRATGDGCLPLPVSRRLLPVSRRLWSVLFVALIPALLPAQSPDDDALLAQVDAAVTPDPFPQFAEAVDGEARQVQIGLEEVARYLRDGNRNAVERALFRFRQASVRRPDWAWPEYAMAHAFLLLHDLAVPVIQSAGIRDGEAHLEATWRHLLEALRRDPTMLPARRLLVELTYPSGDRELRADTRAALQGEMDTGDPLPGAMVVWARHQRINRAHEVALAIFERAEARGADPSIVALERARTLAALGRSDAASAAYWAGVARLTPEGRELYTQDLGWILDADSLQSFRMAAPGEEFGWLRRFWGERDAAAVAAEDSRLREHLRRWAYAHDHYRIPSPWRRNIYTRVDIAFDYIRDACVGSATPFYERLPIHPPTLPRDPRVREPLLDHRGLIYLRHGEPFARTVPPMVLADGESGDVDDPPLPPGLDRTAPGREHQRLLESIADVESWVYWNEGAWRAYHFRGSDALGKHSATTMSSYLPVQSLQAWRALARILPEYSGAVRSLELPLRQPPTCRQDVTPAVRQMRADAALAIESDSDTPRILEPWRAVLRFFALGHEREANGRALLTFALPLESLAADTLPDGSLAWQVRLEVSAWRTSDGSRVTLDTLRTFTARTVPAGGLLSGLLELPLRGGTWHVAVIGRQPGDSAGGAYALRRNLVVNGGEALSISDVVTGLQGGLSWRAPGGTFPVNTLGAWPSGSVVELWYELRGLAAGTPYRSTIEVIPTEARLGDPITFSTTEESTGTLIRIRRTVDLERIRPGRYLLRVQVESGERQAVREQEILVVEER